MQGGVEALDDEVERPVRGDDLDAQLRVAREHVGDDRGQEVAGGRRDGQPQHAARRLPVIGDDPLGVLELGADAAAAGGEQLADLGRAQVSGRALERAHAEASFERGHPARQRGRRDIELGGGARERAAVDHAREHHQVRLLETICHSCSIARLN